MRQLLFALVNAALLVVWGCKSHTVEPGSDLDADFPSTIGMWWQYRVSHTLDGAFDDTVTVSIIDTTRMRDGRKATIWVEQQGASIDTSFVVNDHDTIKICESREYGYAKAMYPSRFRVGYFRVGLDCGDTTRIVDSQLISVPYSHSVWTYRLNRVWGCIDNAGEVSIWLARGLGVVKSQESRITLIGLSVERRELMSFYAPD